jgi:hypothetical protein
MSGQIRRFLNLSVLPEALLISGGRLMNILHQNNGTPF